MDPSPPLPGRTRTRSRAGYPHRRTAARPDLPPGPLPGPGWPVRGTPGGALAALMSELTARGVSPAGMNLTRLQGTLILRGGVAVRYSCGWLGWPTGRTSQRGRPLHTLHEAHDAAGAARRLALTPALRTASQRQATGEDVEA
jgi:hypothetical protein